MQKIGIRIAVFVLIILFLLGIGKWWWDDATQSVDTSSTETKIFVVSPGESVRTIATRLKNEGLIKDQIALFLMVKRMGKDEALQAGDFRLSPRMDVRTIVLELTHGTLDVWVTTLEGWRLEEIALKLAQELSIPETEFLKYGREGYMFPDTYLLPKDATAAAVAAIFSDNFATRVTDDIKIGIETQGLSLEEGVILASIVEREGKGADRLLIAGVLFNRLRDDHPLQADATLQYALGYQAQEKNWWKKTLYNEDKEIKSPYNTYKNIGLPPAPISNPGLESLRSVANPTGTDYYYYLHDPEGGVHFAKTLEEHNENVAKFLR